MSHKRTALAAIGCLVALQEAAFGQSATQNINLNATVADYCTIGGVTSPAAMTRSISVSNGIVSTAAVTPAISVANVVCSKISNVALTSTNTGLTGPASVIGFQNVIHYTAAASFGGATPTLVTSAGTSATSATSGASNGALTVTITPTLNGSPMVAGAYSDTLVVTLTPQP